MSGYRARGSEQWRMEEQEDGTFDVFLGRRRKKSGVDYVEGFRYVRRNYEPAQEVFLVEPDGYKNSITRQFLR